MHSLYVVLAVALFGQAAFGMTCEDGNMISSGLSDADKQLILDHHNYLRQQVAIGNVTDQPQAENMMELTWNDELAQKAQAWADGCVFEHNVETMENNPVGQNLALGMGYNIDQSTFYPVDTMVDSWFNEVYDYGYAGDFKSETGHYSQVIWGNTRLVGCGIAQYTGVSNGYFHKYLVCNYYPAGNYLNQKPYSYGSTACEKHNLNTSATYDALCV